MTIRPDENATLEDLDNAPNTLPRPDQQVRDPELLNARLREVQTKNDHLLDEQAQLRNRIRDLEAQKRTAEALDELIKPYAEKAYIFMCSYSGVVAIFVALDGFETLFSGFGLPTFSLADGVLTTLVGSTAVTVVGLVGMVLTGIFVGARKR